MSLLDWSCAPLPCARLPCAPLPYARLPCALLHHAPYRPCTAALALLSPALHAAAPPFTATLQHRPTAVLSSHPKPPPVLSSLASRLALPFLFSELSNFTTNQPPMYLTLYFFTTRLPDSLRAVRNHFLSLDPTELTLASFETHLLEAETSARAVAASCGSPSLSFFEGCSPSLLVPSVASSGAVAFLGAKEVGAASTSSGKGGRGGDHGGGGGGGGGSEGTGGGGQGLGGSQGGADGGVGLGTAPQLAASGGVEASSVGACESASTGAVLAEALHTFTLDSGASRCFFRDCTTVTPLTAPVPVTLADPSSGQVVARGSTVLPCPVAPSGSLTGLHLPLFATNLKMGSSRIDHGGVASRGAASGGADSGGDGAGGAGGSRAGGSGAGGARAGGDGSSGAGGARAGGASSSGARGVGARGAGGSGAGDSGAGGAGGSGAGGSGVGGSESVLSSLPNVPGPESDLARATSPTVTRFLATLVTDPTFESAAASGLVTELDFAVASRLDYFASLVSESDCPPSVGGELALGYDVLEDRSSSSHPHASPHYHQCSSKLPLIFSWHALLGPAMAVQDDALVADNDDDGSDSQNGLGRGGMVVVKPVAPVAHEPVALVARESVAPAAHLAAESVTPVASVHVAPVVRAPAASAAAHHLLSSHGPSSSSLAFCFFRCTLLGVPLQGVFLH
ncbi:unnamed protein product [Closterium sp. NIES-53]